MDYDLMQYIDMLKKVQKLLSILMLVEVEKLIEVFDMIKMLGIRDCVILEVMYVIGMCVSELIGLKLGDFYFFFGLVQIVGKGDKEWIIFLGDYVI